MEQIIELIEMLGDDFLPVQPNKLGKRVFKLFRYLKGEESPTEDEAAREIGVIPGSSDFRKVKHHLKLALINGVVALNPNSENNAENRIEANHRLWNSVSTGQPGLDSVKNYIANDIVERVLEPARNFDLQEPMVAAYLLLIDSSISGSLKRKDFLRVCQQIDVELDYDFKLQLAHKHYTHSTFLNIKRASDSEKATYLTKAVAEINAIDAIDRFRTWQTSLRLELKLYFAEREYTNAIGFIKTSLPKFDAEDPVQKHTIRIFQNNLLRAFLFACKYAEGVKYGLQLLENEAIMKLTRYATQELTMVLALRSGDYTSAYKVYQAVIAGDGIGVLNDNFKETFLIIEAYIQLIIRLGLVSVDERERSISRLKVGRFINNMSFSSKEKKRRNIHVIIIKLVSHYLYKKDSEFNMADPVRKYVQRHLTDLKTIRAKNFILVLVSFSENGFSLNYAQTERKRYLAELNKYSVGQNDQHPYGELVAFESLWHHIVEQTKE